ncbi:MAG: phenylacetate--CoA ligase family protein [Thermoplasmatales archaeon]|nr:MAG: phenylacetate--CoA ligase family protein [Thermoplasmatales archaeon]
MNYLFNPIFISKVLKSYFFDIDRLWKINEEQLRKYRDKRLRQIVRYAYTVPVYHDKYKEMGIHPADIHGLDDITKLPEISKEEIKHYYPNGIIPSGVDKKNLIEVSTSGTTGKSFPIFVDMYDIVRGLFGYIRTIKEYGINWRKTKMTIIGDFAPHTAESGYITQGLSPHLKLDRLMNNIQWLDTNDDPKKIIREINDFKPEFIGGYVGMLGHLALLQEKGLGKNIRPRYIATTGAVLDKSLKHFIEEQFETQIFEVYGATETGPIAFECKQGHYHIMSDFLHLEFLKDGKPVSSSEPGLVLVTKLFGNGTPIIRYNAINDIAAPLYEPCSCEISSGLIKKIYGRNVLSLILPGGRVLLASGITEIFGRILYELKTNKLKDTRIIQHDMTHIEVQVVIDEQLRDQEPSVDKLFSLLKQGFQEKAGRGVEISLKEIKKVGKNEARIVSKVDRSKVEITQYI